jgi:hypothetical protein
MLKFLSLLRALISCFEKYAEFFCPSCELPQRRTDNPPTPADRSQP